MVFALAFSHFIAADGYDDLQANQYLFDWSDEDRTMDLMKYAIISMFAAVVIVQVVPVNIVCLVGGLAVFIMNTAIFRAAQTTFQPKVMQSIQQKVDFVRDTISSVSRASSRGNKIKKTTVKIFENQVRWSFLGHNCVSSAGGLVLDGSVNY